MKLLDRLLGRTDTKFGYDALEGGGKRKQSTSSVFREDYWVKGSKRDRLQSTAADLTRNLSLASWMVRRHLDYVSQFNFKATTGSKELDDQIEKLMLVDSARQRFDIAGKFTREKMFRLAEMRRVLDGDTALIKMQDGRIQGLQADLISNPPSMNQKQTWIDGIQISQYGRPIRYGVSTRTGYTGTKFVRPVQAKNVIHYGFFDRYAQDQVRGISPLVAGLNPLRDVYENFNYALLKAKVSQLFALAFYRDAEEAPLAIDDFHDGSGPADTDYDHVAAPRGFQAFMKSDTRYVDMDPGEKVEVIESKTPSGEFQNFTQLVIQVAIKCLDIPYSFYDESHTNFFGSRAAWLHYERSCKDKRDDQIEMRSDYTIWKLQQWVLNDRLTLPAGMNVSDIRFDWVPRGMPWWDPSKEINGAVQSIQAGLDTPQRICRSTGTDYFDNVDEIAKATEYAASKGVAPLWAVPDTASQDTALAKTDSDKSKDDKPKDDKPKQISTKTTKPVAPAATDAAPAAGLGMMKPTFDAYGVAVRSGAITPSQADEEQFRSQAKLPPMNEGVIEAWQNDGGYRRPLTIASGDPESDVVPTPSDPEKPNDTQNENTDDSNS